MLISPGGVSSAVFRLDVNNVPRGIKAFSLRPKVLGGVTRITPPRIYGLEAPLSIRKAL